ncbi:hypothetical protein [Parageobacillus galactosidasius]|uniref:Uncharacterized protein n=1 Tax=Parageobacillus galactosidasius TaxID=883812 RepID=A0A226QLQ3_9BACL|nr:hypothetical protein [Parageobacillus galactosidasius]OXB92607.1 hypothetical protein B9L23_15655 [Parageobacillus galactosidasius]
MKKYGIQAINELPDFEKPRRIFSFLNTIGNDKNILREKLQEAFEKFEPREINVPVPIKNVDKFFDRWDHTMFYNKIREFQETTIGIQDGENEKAIKRDDFIAYVGDIDTFIPILGNFLFIDEKESVHALKENQTALYISLAKRANHTVWYLVGPKPDMEDPNHQEREYKLCEILPSGEFHWYKGSLSEIMRYFMHWLEKNYHRPLIDETDCILTARKLISACENEENYTTLSKKLAYLDEYNK